MIDTLFLPYCKQLLKSNLGNKSKYRMLTPNCNYNYFACVYVLRRYLLLNYFLFYNIKQTAAAYQRNKKQNKMIKRQKKKQFILKQYLSTFVFNFKCIEIISFEKLKLNSVIGSIEKYKIFLNVFKYYVI